MVPGALSLRQLVTPSEVWRARLPRIARVYLFLSFLSDLSDFSDFRSLSRSEEDCFVDSESFWRCASSSPKRCQPGRTDSSDDLGRSSPLERPLERPPSLARSLSEGASR